MKWSKLVDRVVLQFGTNPHNKAIARKFLEEAERDLAFNTKCLIKDKSIVANEMDNFFELPNDFLELRGGIIFDDMTLEPYRNQIPRMNFNGDTEKGTPKYYLLTSDQIILIPHPENQGVVNFQYIAQPEPTDAKTSYIKVNYKDLDNGFFQSGDIVKGSISQAYGTVYRDENDLRTGTLIMQDYNEGVHTFGLASPVNPASDTVFLTAGNSSVEVFPASGSVNFEWMVGGQQNSATVTFESIQVSGSSVTLINANVPSVIPMSIQTTINANLRQNETLYVLDDNFRLAEVTGSLTFSEMATNWDQFGLSARATSSSVKIEWQDDDKDDPEIPDIYHLYLVDYAKSMLAENEKEFELADRFMSRYRQNRESVRSQISGKGTGSGSMTVSDLSIRDVL